MDEVAKAHDYVLTINDYSWGMTEYNMSESRCFWTDEMIEGLAHTDREKFEECMRKLSSLSGSDKTWKALIHCVTSDPNNRDYEDNLKTVSDYLFGEEKKKMTKTEIEAELGYKIEIVE